MEVIFIVLPIAILMAGVAVTAFFWAANVGQYDDLDTPQHRILFDDADGACAIPTKCQMGASPTSPIDHRTDHATPAL